MNNFNQNLKKIGEYGEITEMRFPLVTLVGLPHVRSREILHFENGAIGEVYSINGDTVEAVLLTNNNVSIGERVARTGSFLKISTGSGLLGSVINPIGDSYGKLLSHIKAENSVEIEHKPLGIDYRESISEPLSTGVMLVDLLLPLGKGQKQLVIGDRKTGKTTFLFTMMKNQIAHGAVVIYAAIARKQRDIRQLLDFIAKENLTEKIVVVASTSFDSPGLIYLAPFTAMTIGEYFRDQGQDVVVIFDDLSSHAKFYREISLVASRFPGRESYPGDIFFTHARIMERAGNFKLDGGKTASISCLPVVETTEADLTSYIATNIMAMTDGHIFFDQGTFVKGRRPAVNIGLSVTRVGRQAQTPLKRDINQKLMKLLSEYEQVTNLAHFGAELSGKVQKTLNLGEAIYELLNQSNHTPIPDSVQLILIALVWGGDIDIHQLNELKERIAAAAKVDTSRAFMRTLVGVQTLYDLVLSIKKNKSALFDLIGMPIPEAVVTNVTQKVITLSDSIPTEAQRQKKEIIVPGPQDKPEETKLTPTVAKPMTPINNVAPENKS